MKKGFKLIIFIALLVGSTIILIIGTSNYLYYYIDNKKIKSSNLFDDHLEDYYYAEKFMFNTTFVFDSVQFTNINHVYLGWRRLNNSDEYVLRIATGVEQRIPTGYILIGSVCKFSFIANITFNGNDYQVGGSNLDQDDSIFITNFTLNGNQKINTYVEIECNNTQNSDHGTIFESGETSFNTSVYDPIFNSFYLLIDSIIILISIIGMIAGVVFLILTLKED